MPSTQQIPPIPWRVRHVEAELEGHELTPERIDRAAETAQAEAQPLRHNAYKVALGRASSARRSLAVRR
jgi:xanthine dehydrogenase YagS FAD-binding subunit